ncbi:MAG: transcriptional repressor [Anaerolineaceae bacterium]|nr:transcriptional repressor [Anaerolineaceae bacterium]
MIIEDTLSKSLANIWLQKIKENGHRLTSQRRVIVEVMVEVNRALKPIEVYDLGRKSYPNLGLVTVYRTLENLEKLGLLQKVHQPQGCNRYIKSAYGHRHLVICTSCGKVAYFDGFDLKQQFKKVGDELGFQIDDHWLQLFGTCRQCLQKGSIQ